MTQRTGQRRLTRLALITAVTLIGIVALQVFWLCTSWIQQRNRFRADVTSIFDDVAMYESMDHVFMQADKGDVTSFVINVTHAGKKGTSGKPFHISSKDDHTESKSPSTPGVIISLDKDDSLPISQGRIDTLIDSSKAKMIEQLGKHDLHVPFELAIINDKGAIVKSTCDTLRFHRIRLNLKPQPLVSNHGKPRLRLRAAFPDANLYLLRRMEVILSVTVLLILICAWSFSYMLIHFFRQKKMADIRNDFMNNMTHELQTPIAGALVAMELAGGRKHPVTETERTEYIDVAKSEMQRLTALLDRILKMAAFDQGTIPVTKSLQSVYEMVSDALKNMQTITRPVGADVQVTGSQTVSVPADKVQVVHALQNLLENAIKYNDKPRPVVRFVIREEGGGASITITDNGRGIPSAYISRVFDKFFRVPSGDIHDVKGYGLGLSYVKAIVDMHGGTISVSSKEKEGTTFTIFIPFK